MVLGFSVNSTYCRRQESGLNAEERVRNGGVVERVRQGRHAKGRVGRHEQRVQARVAQRVDHRVVVKRSGVQQTVGVAVSQGGAGEGVDVGVVVERQRI